MTGKLTMGWPKMKRVLMNIVLKNDQQQGINRDTHVKDRTKYAENNECHIYVNYF